MSPTQGEFKSQVGLRDLYWALVTQDDLSAYSADTPAQLAPAINANASPASNSNTQYADDGPYDVQTSEGATTIEIETTNIPVQTLATLLGKVYDAATGRMFDQGGTPPDIALSFRSLKSNGSYRYYQYLKGKFAAPNEEHSTKTDTPDPKPATITFTAVKTVHQFDLLGDGSLLDGVKRVIGDEDDANFDGSSWFNAVQVPSAGSPDPLTCTPTPADGGTSVDVEANVVLAFSNPLASGVENGIILTEDDGTIVAVTRSISADRTTVTLNPGSSLSTSTVYLIVVPGIRDIYGQTLADTVYDFETEAA